LSRRERAEEGELVLLLQHLHLAQGQLRKLLLRFAELSVPVFKVCEEPPMPGLVYCTVWL
jgi:hypothetical protein